MARRISTVENLLIHNFGDEAVILNMNNEKYYSLNGVGYRMWQVLTTTSTVEEALAELCHEYDVPEDVLRRDLDSFVQNLNSQLLINTHES